MRVPKGFSGMLFIIKMNISEQKKYNFTFVRNVRPLVLLGMNTTLKTRS